MFGVLDISASALVAQRTRLDVIAGNVAGAFATRDADGRPNPYRRRVALLAPGNPAAGPNARGVHVQQIALDPSPFGKKWDPDHVDAVKSGPDQGYVRLPNVVLSTEMIDAIEAARAYEANVTVMEVTKTMVAASLRMLA